MSAPRVAQPASTRFWKIWAIGITVLFCLLLFAKFFKLTVTHILLIALAILLLLIGFVREKKKPDYRTAIDACITAEHSFTGDYLSREIDKVEVIPDGPGWLVYFWSSTNSKYMVTYRYDPETSVVYGREMNDPRGILKRIQELDVLQHLAAEKILKQKERDALDKHGLDPDSIEGDQHGA